MSQVALSQELTKHNQLLIVAFLPSHTDGRMAFEAEFPHGEKFNGNCTETITIFDFHCYPEADWDSATDNNVTQFLISAGFLPDNDCIVSWQLDL